MLKSVSLIEGRMHGRFKIEISACQNSNTKAIFSMESCLISEKKQCLQTANFRKQSIAATKWHRDDNEIH